MKAQDLKPGVSYLAKRGRNTVNEIKVVELSGTSIKIKYESGYVGWMTKSDFDWEYTIIEQLGTKTPIKST